MVAAIGGKGTVSIRDAHTGAELRSFAFRNFIFPWGLNFSPDGDRLAVTGLGGVIAVWKFRTDERPRFLTGHTEQITSVNFSPDARTIVSTSTDGTIRYWNAHTGESIRTVQQGRNFNWCTAFSPDGSRLAAGNWDGTVKLWNANSDDRVSSLRGHSDKVYGVAFSPNGTRLASTSLDGSVNIWNATEMSDYRVLKDLHRALYVAFDPSGKRLASAHDNGTVNIWDVMTGQNSIAVIDLARQPRFLVFHPDGKRLAVAKDVKTVQLLDVETGRVVHTFSGHKGVVSCVTFSPDGKMMASCGEDGLIKFWDVASGSELQTFKKPNRRIAALAFHPDGKRFVWTSSEFNYYRDANVTMCDLNSGREIRQFKGHDNIPYGLVFTPDGRQMATGSADRLVKLWDVETGAEIRTFQGHTDSVRSVMFNHDTARLVSTSDDGTIQIWDTVSGRSLCILKQRSGDSRNPADYTGGAVFSPDGNLLAAVNSEGAVTIRDARPRTPDVMSETEAVELLTQLFAKPLPKQAVVDAIQSEPILSAEARIMALELVDRFHEERNPSRYNAAALPVLYNPFANLFVCRFALAQMEKACELAPQNESYRAALAFAHYRLGKFQQEHLGPALSILKRCDPKQPLVLAFLAMTQYRLGDREKAETTLAQLQDVMTLSPRAKIDAEVERVLLEASRMISGNHGNTKP